MKDRDYDPRPSMLGVGARSKGHSICRAGLMHHFSLLQEHDIAKNSAFCTTALSSGSHGLVPLRLQRERRQCHVLTYIYELGNTYLYTLNHYQVI
jgi:hypothetical protein